jgi:hypothetical protein
LFLAADLSVLASIPILLNYIYFLAGWIPIFLDLNPYNLLVKAYSFFGRFRLNPNFFCALTVTASPSSVVKAFVPDLGKVIGRDAWVRQPGIFDDRNAGRNKGCIQQELTRI